MIDRIEEGKGSVVIFREEHTLHIRIIGPLRTEEKTDFFHDSLAPELYRNQTSFRSSPSNECGHRKREATKYPSAIQLIG